MLLPVRHFFKIANIVITTSMASNLLAPDFVLFSFRLNDTCIVNALLLDSRPERETNKRERESIFDFVL